MPAVFSQDPLEKFFGQARQRCGGNFYIDVGDVLAAAKVQRLHQMLKRNMLPQPKTELPCSYCTKAVDQLDLELLLDVTIDDTQLLLDSDDTLKQKIVFIGGFLAHKFRDSESEDELREPVNSTFISELNRGGLSVPRLSTAFFVHAAIHLLETLPYPKSNCRVYLMKVLSFVDSQLAENIEACRTLANVLLKAHVNDNSDREKYLGCLRRKEKLQ